MLIPAHFDDLTIGMEVEKPLGKLWRVVRLIKDSITRFKDLEGNYVVVTESFAQLLNLAGEIDFEVYSCQNEPWTKSCADSVGLSWIHWKK